MNTSVRARHGSHGFSFVELLVTIIIAAIAFAALVPVFVAASQKGAGDTDRNVSLNLAQDKVEKIRQLDYDLLTEDNLNSTSFSDGGFGPTASVSGGGDTKSYKVSYTVTFVGGKYDGQDVVNYSSGDKTEAYKQVVVDVYWEGNPKPVKHAVLKTLVYKQYAGSYTNVLVVSPTNIGIDPSDSTRVFLTSYSITLTAYVNEADALNTKNVTFTVFNSSGNQIAKLVRATTDVQYVTAGVFSQTYTILGAAGSQDGTYTFKATAVSKRGYVGNTQVVTLPVEMDAPASPSGLDATPSDGTVGLSWDQSPTGDVVAYEVYRNLDGGSDFGANPIGPPVTFVAGHQPTYQDTGLMNDTVYYYAVRAVDGLGHKSALSLVASATPKVPADDVPPNPVTVASASAFGTQAPPLKIRLTWTRTTDAVSPAPKPTSGMKCYYIYRSDDNGATYAATPTYTVNEGDIAYYNASTGTYALSDDSGLQPLKSYYYKIISVDNALNLSTSAMIVSATTLNYSYCSVTVYNSNTTTGASLKVTNPDGTAIATWPGVTNPSSPASVAKKKGLVWQLPVGFAFQALWKLNTASVYTPKSIPLTGGVITSTTSMTVSFP